MTKCKNHNFDFITHFNSISSYLKEIFSFQTFTHNYFFPFCWHIQHSHYLHAVCMLCIVDICAKIIKSVKVPSTTPFYMLKLKCSYLFLANMCQSSLFSVYLMQMVGLMCSYIASKLTICNTLGYLGEKKWTFILQVRLSFSSLICDPVLITRPYKLSSSTSVDVV